MENILRSAINTALQSVIHPLDADDFSLSKEDGFVLRDVLVDHEQLNATLDKATEGTVRINRCFIKELRVNYDWADGTALVEVDNVSFSVAPKIGKMVKKKILGCLDYEEDAKARRKGSNIYDPGWNNAPAIPRYCPYCSCDLRPYSNHTQDYLSPPRLIVSHQSLHAASPSGNNSRQMDGRYQQNGGRSMLPRITPGPSPVVEYNFRAPPNREKRSQGLGCYAVIENVKKTIEEQQELIPHPYMAETNSPTKPLRSPVNRGTSRPHKRVDYDLLAELGDRYDEGKFKRR